MKSTKKTRNLNNRGGAFEFDGWTVINTTNGLTKTQEEAMRDFAEIHEGEARIVLCYNRNGYVEFKALTIAELIAHPFLLYWNGSDSNSNGFEFGFKFVVSTMAKYLESCDDVYDVNGNKLRMTEEDFVKIANHCKDLNKFCNNGNICEYIISGNELDITDPTRDKKHDVYIYTLNKKTGELSPWKKPAECKASFSGQAGKPIGTDLKIWDKELKDFRYGLSKGYKKSNGAVKYDGNMRLKKK